MPQTMQQKRTNSLLQLQAAKDRRVAAQSSLTAAAREHNLKSIQNLDRMIEQTQAAIVRGGR